VPDLPLEYPRKQPHYSYTNRCTTQKQNNG
jgi:hypothetical protein